MSRGPRVGPRPHGEGGPGCWGLGVSAAWEGGCWKQRAQDLPNMPRWSWRLGPGQSCSRFLPRPPAPPPPRPFPGHSVSGLGPEWGWGAATPDLATRSGPRAGLTCEVLSSPHEQRWAGSRVRVEEGWGARPLAQGSRPHRPGGTAVWPCPLDGTRHPSRQPGPQCRGARPTPPSP